MKDNPPKDLSKEGEYFGFLLFQLHQCLSIKSSCIYKECERIIIYCLLEDVLHPKVVFTAYNTIVYLILGPCGRQLLMSPNPRAQISFPIKSTRKQTATNPLAKADEDGWISARAPAAKAKSSKTTAKAKKPAGGASKGKKESAKTKVGKKGPKRKGAASKSALEIVELCSSSSNSESDDDDIAPAKRRTSTRTKTQKQAIHDDTPFDSDSDYEFSG